INEGVLLAPSFFPDTLFRFLNKVSVCGVGVSLVELDNDEADCICKLCEPLVEFGNGGAGGICELCEPPVEFGNGGAGGICELCGPPVEFGNDEDDGLPGACVLTFRTESNKREILCVGVVVF
ncbi:hypothetical protein, partial [Providencia alcalifaciens]|uniref:hypothetical protein n=1 Tax=Providencia alcalifaciens TaxID=126385 RepID=UPI00055C104E